MKAVRHLLTDEKNRVICKGVSFFEKQKELDAHVKRLYDIKLKMAFRKVNFELKKPSDVYRKVPKNRARDFGEKELTKIGEEASEANIYSLKIDIDYIY